MEAEKNNVDRILVRFQLTMATFAVQSSKERNDGNQEKKVYSVLSCFVRIRTQL